MPASTALRPALLVCLLVTIAACAGAAAPIETARPSAAASAVASSVAVDTPEEAAELVLAQDERFAGFGPEDPDLIGQCCWYRVDETADGYEVLIHAGWGDCPAGCINQHEWGFRVTRDGQVTLVGESGDPVPAEGFEGAGVGG